MLAWAILLISLHRLNLEYRTFWYFYLRSIRCLFFLVTSPSSPILSLCNLGGADPTPTFMSIYDQMSPTRASDSLGHCNIDLSVGIWPKAGHKMLSLQFCWNYWEKESFFPEETANLLRCWPGTQVIILSPWKRRLSRMKPVHRKMVRLGSESWWHHFFISEFSHSWIKIILDFSV